MAPIYPGMKVHMTDGATAVIIDVLINPDTLTERYIVLSARGIFGPNVIAPCSNVWHVDDCVRVNLTSADVAALPVFESVTSLQESGLVSRATGQHANGGHHHVAPRS